MKTKWNVAIIGCSDMGKQHIKGLLKNEKAVLYALCDSAPERVKAAAEEFKPEIAVTDYRELVNDPKLDAVILVVPDQIHLELTEAFLRAGKAVLCEKPMALNLEECEKMIAVERETGGKLMIGQVCRFTPAFVKAKELVASGRIGELMFVESEYAHNYSVARGYNDWRVVPERHGFIGGGCHAVDLLRWIAGDPIEVFGYANHKGLPDWPCDDTAIAVYKFPNNVMGKVFVSIGCRRNYTMRSVFYGTKGTIICDNTSEHLTLFEADANDSHASYNKPNLIPINLADHNTTGEIEMFLDALTEDKPMPVSSIEGASTVAVCVATVESTKTGVPVQIKYPV